MKNNNLVIFIRFGSQAIKFSAMENTLLGKYLMEDD